MVVAAVLLFVALLLGFLVKAPPQRSARTAMVQAAARLGFTVSDAAGTIRGDRGAARVKVSIRLVDPESSAEETVVEVVPAGALAGSGPLPERLRPRGCPELETAAAWVSARDVRLITPLPLTDPALIVEAVERMLHAAEILRAEAEELRRVCLDRSLHASDADTRGAAIARLLELFPASPEAQDAVGGGLLDPDPRVALLAGLAAGAEAVPALERLARDRSAPEEVRAGALRRLTEVAAPGERLFAVLEDGLADPSIWVQQIAIYHLGNGGHRRVLPKLIELAPAAPAPLLPMIAKALGRMGDASAEGALIGLLERGDHTLAIAAAEALSKIGTTLSIDALLRCRARSAALIEENVRFILDAAIGLIRERAGELGRGALSITGDPSGINRGRLAFAQDGELSPPGGDAATRNGSC